MAVPHSLYDEEGGVKYDSAKCTHCGQCAEVCPTGTITAQENQIRIVKGSSFGCIACGHCMMVCPENCITVNGRGISPADLVELPYQESKATASSLSALMLGRRSIRKFKTKEVDQALLDAIVEMASTAPMGIPPWDVGCVVINGRSKVQEVVKQIIGSYQTILRIFSPFALKLMRPFMPRAKYRWFVDFLLPLARDYVSYFGRGEDVLFYNAPAVMIFYHSQYAESGDAMIACTYAMLAAESLGLGTTMIGAAAPMIARNKKLKNELEIPAANIPAIALIIGYPLFHYKRGIRRHFNHVSKISG